MKKLLKYLFSVDRFTFMEALFLAGAAMTTTWWGWLTCFFGFLVSIAIGAYLAEDEK